MGRVPKQRVPVPGHSVVELRTVLHMHLYGAGRGTFVPAHPYPCAMQHKGIEYTLAPDHGPHPWAWVAHTSPPKSGRRNPKLRQCWLRGVPLIGGVETIRLC